MLYTMWYVADWQSVQFNDLSGHTSAHSGATVEHEATTSKIGEDQLFYCQQRGIDEEMAQAMIVNGFCRGVFKQLPSGAVQAQRLLDICIERQWVN